MAGELGHRKAGDEHGKSAHACACDRPYSGSERSEDADRCRSEDLPGHDVQDCIANADTWHEHADAQHMEAHDQPRSAITSM